MRKKAVSGMALILLLLSMVMLASNIQPVKAEPATIIVPDYYPTIQEAIYAAKPGDAVLVQAGIYYEHLFIDKPIQLIGESKQDTIIDGSSSGTLISVGSDNVTISEFTLRNAGNTWLAPQHTHIPDCAIWVYRVNNINISDNTVTGAAVCIFCAYATNAIVCNNSVSQASSAGIIFYSATRCRAYSNNLTSCGIAGIHLDYYATHCLIANNSILSNPQCIGLDIEQGSTRNVFRGNLIVNNYVGIFLFNLGSDNVFRENNLARNGYNFGLWGSSLGDFVQDIDASNTINDNPVFYMVNRHHLLMTQTNATIPSYIGLVNCSYVTIKGLNFSSNWNGILLAGATNCTLANVNLTRNHEGILLFESYNNVIISNRFDSNSVAATVYSSHENVFYHNSFLNNTRQISSQFLSRTNEPYGPSGSSTNRWDNRLEGNFWSDYNGSDSNRDGIGDSPYVIDANNQDRYPLMNPWREETGLAPFWMQWWFWSIVAATGIMLSAGAIYFLRKRKPLS